jgi:hypothetical protein
MIYQSKGFIYIECSNCGSFGDVSIGKLDNKKRTELRERMQSKNWKVVLKDGVERDLCETCASSR